MQVSSHQVIKFDNEYYLGQAPSCLSANKPDLGFLVFYDAQVAVNMRHRKNCSKAMNITIRR